MSMAMTFFCETNYQKFISVSIATSISLFHSW